MQLNEGRAYLLILMASILILAFCGGLYYASRRNKRLKRNYHYEEDTIDLSVTSVDISSVSREERMDIRLRSPKVNDQVLEIIHI